MASKTYTQLEVRRQGEHMIVRGAGATPKGKKYIKAQEVIEDAPPGSPEFKKHLRAAVTKLFS